MKKQFVLKMLDPVLARSCDNLRLSWLADFYYERYGNELTTYNLCMDKTKFEKVILKIYGVSFYTLLSDNDETISSSLYF